MNTRITVSTLFLGLCLGLLVAGCSPSRATYEQDYERLTEYFKLVSELKLNSDMVGDLLGDGAMLMDKEIQDSRTEFLQPIKTEEGRAIRDRMLALRASYIDYINLMNEFTSKGMKVRNDIERGATSIPDWYQGWYDEITPKIEQNMTKTGELEADISKALGELRARVEG